MIDSAAINSAIKINDTILSSFTIIPYEEDSYNSGGNTNMSKPEKENVIKYSFGNSVVSVERHFANDIHIHDIIKKYMVERNNNNVLPFSKDKCYNSHSNTTVEDFSEGRNK